MYWSSLRFSLLLLEFGEIYFEDFSVICYPNVAASQDVIERYPILTVQSMTYSVDHAPLLSSICMCTFFYSLIRKQRGRLKVCSESLIFDPLDFNDPVVKVCYCCTTTSRYHYLKHVYYCLESSNSRHSRNITLLL